MTLIQIFRWAVIADLELIVFLQHDEKLTCKIDQASMMSKLMLHCIHKLNDIEMCIICESQLGTAIRDSLGLYAAPL